jgi:hypothetical protein
MQKNFIIAIILIIIGNSIITISEKVLIHQTDFSTLSQQILQEKVSNSAMPAIEQTTFINKMLNTKLKIWMISFVVLSALVNIFFESRKKILYTTLICFYILGCSINIFSVPHPLWFKIGVVPFVIVSFLVTDQLIMFMKGFTDNRRHIENEKRILAS